MPDTGHGPLKFLSALAAGVFLSAPALATDVDKGELAKKARGILQTYCYRCHGQDGTIEGGMNYVLDLKALVTRKKLDPGNPERSKLVQRLLSADDPMPPGGEKLRPGKAEIALLQQWIASGAPDVPNPASKRQPIPTTETVRLIAADVAKLPERDRRFARFFTITHLYNAGLSEDELQTYRNGLAKLLNSLSWQPEIVRPHALDSARSIFRIDLRDLGWDPALWQHILAEYPYHVTLAAESVRSLYAATACELPYVRADWFVHAAARPPLYHDILQMPPTDRELETKLNVKVLANIDGERVVRAGFNNSGVSQNNRLIERHPTAHGAYWKSYDFAGNAERRNLFAYPLGPAPGDHAFTHDGGEILFNLPNGLQAYLLVDAKGQRLNKGPTAIVSDPKRPDRAVENGISCMSCHARGIITKGDQVRGHVAANPNAFPAKERERILALYPPAERFNALLREDAGRFAKAVARTGSPLGATEPIVALALQFEADLDLVRAAAEVGITPEELVKALGRSEKLARDLGILRTPGAVVKRQAFASTFPLVIGELRLGVTPQDRAVSVGNRNTLLLAKPPANAKPLTEGELVQALNDLESKTSGVRNQACKKLAGAQPNGDQAKVVTALRRLLESREWFLRSAAAEALIVWGSKDDLPALLKLVNDDHFNVRWDILKFIGDVSDEQAAKVVARRLDSEDRTRASKALQRMGPVAEQFVVPHLQNEAWEIRMEACKVLETIGTKQSAPDLQAVTRDKNALVRKAAAHALAAVKGREQDQK